MKKEVFNENYYDRENVFVQAWKNKMNQIRRFSVDMFENQQFTNLAFIDAVNVLSDIKSLRDKILESGLNDFTKEKIDTATNVVDFYFNKCKEVGYNPHKEKNNYSKLSFMLELYPKLNSLN